MKDASKQTIGDSGQVTPRAQGVGQGEQREPDAGEQGGSKRENLFFQQEQPGGEPKPFTPQENGVAGGCSLAGSVKKDNSEIPEAETGAQEVGRPDGGKNVTSDCRQAAEEASFVHPADLADHLENLDLESQVCALKRMPREDAAEALAELDENVAVDVLENLDADDAAQIIAEMEPDDAADVLDELDEDHRDVLLGHLKKEDSDELRNL